MNELPFIEMFSGIGGFRLGLEHSGWNCVWANDIDKWANKIYKKKFGIGELVEGDIKTININSIPNHTLLTAGFPCQAFSIAGKRKGFQDVRGTLFYEIARIANVKRPKLLFLENVKGLLSAKAGVSTGIYQATKGKRKGEITLDMRRIKNEPERGWKEVKVALGKGYCFWKILQTLQELGYMLEWQVFDSQYFGVPQHRERVFVVGHFGRRSGREIFPIFGGDKKNMEVERRRETSSTIDASYYKGHDHKRQLICVKNGGTQADRIYDPQGISPTLPTSGGGRHEPKILTRSRSNNSYKENDKFLALTVSDNFQNRIVLPCLTPNRPKRQEGRRMKEKDEPMFTLTKRDVHGVVINENDKIRIRKLTPTECERLQGFRDGWTKEVSNTQRYKVLGNAVTVNVIEFLGQKLKECLEVD